MPICSKFFCRNFVSVTVVARVVRIRPTAQQQTLVFGVQLLFCQTTCKKHPVKNKNCDSAKIVANILFNPYIVHVELLN